MRIAYACVLLTMTGCAAPTPIHPTPAFPTVGAVDVQPLLVIPDVFDCGIVSQCEMPQPISAILRNTSDKPIRLRGFVATCGCTIPDLRPNTEIAAGGELAMNIRLELWGQGRKQQFIRFIDEESKPLGRIQVRYEVCSPLRSTPSGIARDVNPDGSFQIESADDVPFSITDSQPPVVVTRSLSPATDHSLSVDWAAADAFAVAHPAHPDVAVDAVGNWTTLLVRISTDKLDCSQVFLWLRNNATTKPQTH